MFFGNPGETTGKVSVCPQHNPAHLTGHRNLVGGLCSLSGARKQARDQIIARWTGVGDGFASQETIP